MPCAELPQLHLHFAEAEQPPGQGRHTLGESMRQEPGCPFCARQIASHNSLAVPPTLPAAMQEADRAQLGPCVPAQSLCPSFCPRFCAYYHIYSKCTCWTR